MFIIVNSHFFLKNKFEFEGKVALVSGGSTGIGYSTALFLAREGAQVIIIARNSRPECYNGESAETTINQDSEVIQAQGKAKFYKVDISKSNEVEELFQIILKEYGKLDVAVNNA